MLKPSEAVTLVNDLLGTKKYEWARETLEGIVATVQVTNKVTLRQQEAIEHIMLGRLKHEVG